MIGGVPVELVGVGKQHRSPAGVVDALTDITLRIPAGEQVAITGPSGCGKSTLLGLVAGLDIPSAGRVAVGDQEVSAMPDDERADLRRRSVGLVFQADNLLPFLTATENVSLQRSLEDATGAAERSRDLLARLGLADEVDRYPDELSGGQRQRVAVARALVHRPSLVVADEPTGSLDAANAMGVVDLLLDAVRDSGATLLLVTHERAVADRLERTVALRDGRLQ
jgi:putative ABC transport system ATP-binding protein